MKRVAIKVDIDTLRGYTTGLPRLLALFKRHEITASIFFSFGPDNSGKAIRRIFRKGFLGKMFRTKAPSTYGLKTLMYGTLLPAPMIVESDPAIFAQAADLGHDCGVHAWDHVYVQDNLQKISADEFTALFRRAADMFERLCGKKPLSYAAPGWQISKASLEAIDCLGLDYASNTRGVCPFIPIFEGQTFKTPEIPTTLPTMDEIMGLPGVTDTTMPGLWSEMMSDGLNVLTIHAEMEGISKLSVFENFIKLMQKEETDFVTLRDAAEQARFTPRKVAISAIKGRAGTLALQEAD